MQQACADGHTASHHPRTEVTTLDRSGLLNALVLPRTHEGRVCGGEESPPGHSPVLAT